MWPGAERCEQREALARLRSCGPSDPQSLFPRRRLGARAGVVHPVSRPHLVVLRVWVTRRAERFEEWRHLHANRPRMPSSTRTTLTGLRDGPRLDRRDPASARPRYRGASSRRASSHRVEVLDGAQAIASSVFPTTPHDRRGSASRAVHHVLGAAARVFSCTAALVPAPRHFVPSPSPSLGMPRLFQSDGAVLWSLPTMSGRPRSHGPLISMSLVRSVSRSWRFVCPSLLGSLARPCAGAGAHPPLERDRAELAVHSSTRSSLPGRSSSARAFTGILLDRAARPPADVTAAGARVRAAAPSGNTVAARS